MIDIAELELRLKKAQLRASKAKSAFDAASTDVERLTTALSVLNEILGAATNPSSGHGGLTKKQLVLHNSLRLGKNNALSPVDVYQVAAKDLEFDGDVNYVRTTLWRMADKGSIGSANGTYWRFEGDNEDKSKARVAAEVDPQSPIDVPESPANPWEDSADDFDDVPW